MHLEILGIRTTGCQVVEQWQKVSEVSHLNLAGFGILWKPIMNSPER